MTIQQSINQMLYTGTVAAGLYAHSPEGQKQAKIRALNDRIKGIEKRALIEGEGDISARNYEKMGELEEEKFAISPKEKYFNKAVSYYEKQIEAEESMKKRQAERKKQKQTMTTTQETLKGDLDNGNEE